MVSNSAVVESSVLVLSVVDCSDEVVTLLSAVVVSVVASGVEYTKVSVSAVVVSLSAVVGIVEDCADSSV